MKHVVIPLLALLMTACSSTWKPQVSPNGTDTSTGRQDMTYRSGV